METRSVTASRTLSIVGGVLVLVGLYFSSLYSYLLFHTLVEVFSIVVAAGIFMIAWNSRRFMKNDYLAFLGIAYLSVACIDLLHTMIYKGMGIFPEFGSNPATQLWIAARYMESLSLLAAPLFFCRRLRHLRVLAGFTLAISLLFLSIFYWHIFPTCYVEGVGLTAFKKVSEYAISLILVGALLLLLRNRRRFHEDVLAWLTASLLLTIGSELAFTFYVSVYGLSNLVGHMFKLVSFFAIYKAIIQTGLVRPYDLVFRDLRQSEDALQKARGKLETRVAERTADLATANVALGCEIAERKKAEEALSRRAADFAALYDTARSLAEQQDMHSRLKLITDHAAALLNASLGFVYLFDSESNDLILMVAKDSPIPIGTRLRLGEGMAGRVAQDFQPLIVDDYRVWEGRSSRYEGAPFSAVVEVPMIHSGELVGVLGVREAGDTTRRFTEEDVRLLSLFAAQAASAMQNARLLEKLKRNTEQLEQRVVERTAELEVAKEGAESADRLKSIFLASMSHELRTPLNSIIGFTGILLQGMSGELNEEQRKQLSLVQGSGRHLLELINDVLDISKIEAGEVRLVLGKFELADLVREVVDLFSPVVTEKGLDLIAEVPNLAITSDRRRVKQVLMNLVSNAVKFTDQGQVSIIGTVLETQTLEIRVRDTGPGMEEEETKRLFQPFQQIDDSLTRRHEGTGLGLYLTKTLLALLGGNITVKCEYGKGSEFTFTLPVKRGEEGE